MDRQVSIWPDSNIHQPRKVRAVKQEAQQHNVAMHVGIGKRQSRQSIAMEDDAIATKRAAKLNLIDSVIWCKECTRLY